MEKHSFLWGLLKLVVLASIAFAVFGGLNYFLRRPHHVFFAGVTGVALAFVLGYLY